MAPRIRKRGSLRIDAALDAMRPFGFPSKLVRDTVKELLIVYGGEDGWVFIEEGSYTLLIDTLLEKQKDGAIEQVREENGRSEVYEETSGAGCSYSCVNETSSSNPGAELTVKQSDDVLISPYEDNEASRITTPLPTNDSEERCQERCRKHNEVSGVNDHFRSPLPQSSPAARLSKSIRNRPYRGWISNDNNEEDLVYLTPGPLPEEFAKLLMTSPRGQRKRKKRWDVQPAES